MQIATENNITKLGVGLREVYKIGAFIDALIADGYFKNNKLPSQIMVKMKEEYGFVFASTEWKRTGKKYPDFYKQVEASLSSK